MRAALASRAAPVATLLRPAPAAPAATGEDGISSTRRSAAAAEEAAMRLIQTLNAPTSPGVAVGVDPSPAAQRAAQALAAARARIAGRDAHSQPTSPSTEVTRAQQLLDAVHSHAESH